jgi:hypothetical protein
MPLTLAAWVIRSGFTTQRIPLGIFYTSGAGTNLDGWFLNTNTSAQVIAQTGDGTSTSGSTTTATMSANVWAHIGGVFTSSTSRTAYLNGVAATVNTTSRTPTASNKTSIGIGYSQNNTVTGRFDDGYIAEVGIWNVALTAADMLILATGASPIMVKPESLVAYYPMIRGDANGDMPDLIGGLTMVEQGTVAVQSHPRVYYPGRSQLRWTTVGGGTDALTATNITTAAPTLGAPTIGQKHVLTSTSITTGATSVAAPTIGQKHALTSTAITTSAPTVGAPTIGQKHALTSTAITTAAPTLGAPTLLTTGTSYTLVATDITAGAPTLDAPTAFCYNYVFAGVTEEAFTVPRRPKVMTVSPNDLFAEIDTIELEDQSTYWQFEDGTLMETEVGNKNNGMSVPLRPTVLRTKAR